MLEKDQTNETVFRKDYHQLRERISSCFKAYTDGSQREQKVAVATIFPEEPEHSLAVRLRDGSSVLMPNLNIILLDLKKFSILAKTNKKFIIYTDRFSAVQSLRGKPFRSRKRQAFLQPPQNYHHKSKCSLLGSLPM